MGVPVFGRENHNLTLFVMRNFHLTGYLIIVFNFDDSVFRGSER